MRDISKGINQLMWMFIVLTLTLLFLVFAASPLQASVNEAISSNMRFRVQEIVSILNVLQSSPDKTTYTYTLPRMECVLLFSQNTVKLTIKQGERESVITQDTLKTLVPIGYERVECSKERETTITFVKDGNNIGIS